MKVAICSSPWVSRDILHFPDWNREDRIHRHCCLTDSERLEDHGNNQAELDVCCLPWSSCRRDGATEIDGEQLQALRDGDSGGGGRRRSPDQGDSPR